MANRFARKAGNFHDTDVWSDTPSGTAGAEFIPGAADVAIANSFAIAVTADATCLEVRNDTTGGATLGGGFTLSNGVTLTADVWGAGTVSTYCVIFNLASPNSASIVGNVDISGTAGNSRAVHFNGSGTLNITGNITNVGGGLYSYPIVTGGTGTLNITGNLTSSSASRQNLYLGSVCTVNIYGNCDAGTGTAACIYAHTSSNGTSLYIEGNVLANATNTVAVEVRGSCEIVGNLSTAGGGRAVYVNDGSDVTVTGDLTHTGTTNGTCIYLYGTATGTVTGTVTGGAGTTTGAHSIELNGITGGSGSSLTLNGNAVGGSGYSGHAIYVGSGATLTINGDAKGSPTTYSSGVTVESTGTLILNGSAIGNGYGPGSTGIAGAGYGVLVNGQQSVTIKNVQAGVLGCPAVDGPFMLASDGYATPVATDSYTATRLDQVPLVVPAEADVVADVVYGDGAYTGSLSASGGGSTFISMARGMA